MQSRPTDKMERSLGYPDQPVAGVDEVGRGPLAGPVVAAAVILPSSGLAPDLAKKINDSKVVSKKLRSELATRILASCATAIAKATVQEIDELNILHASMLAMDRAVAALPQQPVAALIDGNRCPPGLPCPGHTIVKGDSKCLSIAAASIIAKVHRDRLMASLALTHPGYGWERNAGYPTAEHRGALATLGVTEHHRRSFAPVSQQLKITD